jgi:hypothetical protein
MGSVRFVSDGESRGDGSSAIPVNAYAPPITQSEPPNKKAPCRHCKGTGVRADEKYTLESFAIELLSVLLVCLIAWAAIVTLENAGWIINTKDGKNWNIEALRRWARGN